jgi:secreted trypsin-like serine protease
MVRAIRAIGIARVLGASALLAVLGLLGVLAPAAGAIVGGRPADRGTYGYVADVRISGSFGCTGTLIAPQWVLTAGHCGSVTGALTGGLLATPAAWPASAFSVQIGSVYADGRGGETHAVTDVLVDSDYVFTNGTGNDVTLLKLDRPSSLQPVKIAAVGERSIWKPGTLATIAGFGTTSESASAPPDQMQVARVPVTTDADCAAAYPGGLSTVGNDGSFDASTMLCAGYPKGGTDTCEGDSGGPLLVAASDGSLRLAGATSFGAGCARAGKPGVYARLAEGPIRSFVARFVPAAFAPEPAVAATPARSVAHHRAQKHHRATAKHKAKAKAKGKPRRK